MHCFFIYDLVRSIRGQRDWVQTVYDNALMLSDTAKVSNFSGVQKGVPRLNGCCGGAAALERVHTIPAKYINGEKFDGYASRLHENGTC